MNALMFFCAWMAFVYIPFWDLPKPVSRDEEVWFGLTYEDRWAKLMLVPHWFVYAAGALGFWRMRAWMWPWAAVYAAQMTIGMFVWSVAYVGGVRGWVLALLLLAVFSGLTLALWGARERFQRPRPSLRQR